MTEVESKLQMATDEAGAAKNPEVSVDASVASVGDDAGTAAIGHSEQSSGVQTEKAGLISTASADETDDAYCHCLELLLQHSSMKLGLESLVQVADLLGNPQNEFQAVHVAGQRVGVYTSPHIASLRERIVVDGKQISKSAFVETFDKVRRAAESVGVELTFFERLSLASVGWDHMDLLGKSLEEIAAEKAGILVMGARVALGESYETLVRNVRSAVLKGLELRAAFLLQDRLPQSVTQFGGELKNSIVRLVVEKVLRLEMAPSQLNRAVSTRLRTRAQQLNQTELVSVAETLGLSSKLASLPIAVILDVAHNESAFERLMQMVAHRFYGRLVYAIVGLSANRQADVLVPFFSHLLAPKNQRWGGLYLVSGRHPRLQPPVTLFRTAIEGRFADSAAKEALTNSMLKQCCWLSGRSKEEVEVSDVANLVEECCVPGPVDPLDANEQVSLAVSRMESRQPSSSQRLAEGSRWVKQL